MDIQWIYVVLAALIAGATGFISGATASPT